MPAPLTDEWIEDQLKLCEEATKGPWLASHGSGTGHGHLRVKATNHLTPWMQRQADCHFIEAMREGYPLLLKEVLRLRAEQNAEAECVSCGEMFPQSELVDEICASCGSYEEANSASTE